MIKKKATFYSIMTNPKIEVDIAEILQRLETKFDKIDKKFDKLDDGLHKIEIGQIEIKGEIKALDTKVEQLNVRIGNVEFASRGILIGISVVILGGFAMAFGLVKP